MTLNLIDYCRMSVSRDVMSDRNSLVVRQGGQDSRQGQVS